jgi:predicted ATPase
VQTNWHVITGAPSCGKTTLIDLLAREGFHIAPEGGRLYMEREAARGKTTEEIRAHISTLQRGIKTTQLGIERSLRPAHLTFLDRSVLDSLAWYRLFGLDPNEFLPECFHHRYASVFILERLPLTLDGFRFDDDAIVDYLDEWHYRDYRTLGYAVLRVPVLPPEERCGFVLERLSEGGMI